MAKSVVDIACERIDAQVADLLRAKDMILSAAMASTDAPKVRKPRSKNKPKGLPKDDGTGMSKDEKAWVG